MVIDITLNGEEYTVSGDYLPAGGDGWEEPHYPESFDVYAVWDYYGKEVINWEDQWSQEVVEQGVLEEIHWQQFQDESDDPYKD